MPGWGGVEPALIWKAVPAGGVQAVAGWRWSGVRCTWGSVVSTLSQCLYVLVTQLISFFQ